MASSDGASARSEIMEDMEPVGGLEHFLFSYILGVIIQIDEYFEKRVWNHQPGKLLAGDMTPDC